MASEGFDMEEWDADFLDQLVQAEEIALSTQTPHQHQHHHHPPPPPPRRPPPQSEISYSPPRELSQRTNETHRTGGIPDAFAPRGTDVADEHEVDSLKKELIRVTEQLNNKENECLELRKVWAEKEEQLKVLSISDLSPVKIAGRVAQADKATDTSASDLQNACHRSEKLFALWNPNDQKRERVLGGNLYKTCEADFHELFGYLNSLERDSKMASSDQHSPTQPVEYAKILHLTSVFTKITHDNLRLEELLDALLGLSNLNNVFLVHWSLRVLHKILSNSFVMEKELRRRENVIVEEDPLSEYSKSNTNGCGYLANENSCFANVVEMLKQAQIPSALQFSIVKAPGFSGFFNHSFATSVPGVYQVSLFERMCLIATENNEERIRREALSIMNLILMRHNAYSEREKFAGELVFRSLSQLLKKEAGFSVQDLAVRALHLLCNCPKVEAMVFSCLREDGVLEGSKDINENSFPTFQGLNEILIGLADCVASYGSATAEEMKLRKNAIVFLAFLGSSGKSGFEILLYHRLPKGTNFLAIILQSIISDLDRQGLKSAKKSGIGKEQSLLIREALILLNRLVSHPQWSVPVLQALTATRDMACSTVDFANRLTQKGKLSWQGDEKTRRIQESEILELAGVFKKRVLTFLGDNLK